MAPSERGRGLCPRRGSLLQGLGHCVTQGRTRIKGCGSLVAPPFPLPFPSLCQCLHQGSPGESGPRLTPDSAVWIPHGLEAGHAREKGDLPFWAREDHRTHPTGCSYGWLRSALSSLGTVSPLCPQGATPKAGHQPCPPQGRQPGRKREGHPCGTAPALLLPA